MIKLPPARRHQLTAPTTGAIIWGAAVIFMLVGMAAGVAWWAWVTPPQYEVTSAGAMMEETQLARQVSMEVLFVIIGAVGAVIGSIVVFWRAQTAPGTAYLPVVVGTAVGSCLATGMMWSLGSWLGPADPASRVDAAAVGDQLAAALSVTIPAAFLVWPFVALSTLVVLIWVWGAESTPEPDAANESA